MLINSFDEFEKFYNDMSDKEKETFDKTFYEMFGKSPEEYHSVCKKTSEETANFLRQIGKNLSQKAELELSRLEADKNLLQTAKDLQKTIGESVDSLYIQKLKDLTPSNEYEN